MPLYVPRIGTGGDGIRWKKFLPLLLVILAFTSILPAKRHLIHSPLSITSKQSNGGCNLAAVPSADRCAFVKAHAQECGATIGHINYMRIAYCSFGDKPAVAIALLCVWTTVIFAVMLITAEHFFCPALEELAQYLQLPDHLAGATLMAFGNGANDCFVMTAALVASGEDGGAAAALSEALSGGFFIVNVVLGLVVIFAPTHPVLVGTDFRRDILFYLGAVLLVFGCMFDGKLHMWEALLMFVYYVMYIAVTVRTSRSQVPLEAPHPVATIHHEIPRRPSLPLPPLEEGTSLADVQAPLLMLQYSLSGEAPTLTRLSPPTTNGNPTTPQPPNTTSTQSLGPYSTQSLGPYSRQTSALSQAVVEKLDSLQQTKATAEWPLVLLLRLLMPQVDPGSPYPRWCAALLPCTAPVLWVLCWGGGVPEWPGVGSGVLLAILASACIWSAYPADGQSFGPLAGVFVVFAFLQSMLLLSMCSTELMATSVAVGSLAGLSQSLLAATLLAWGNSLQDLVSNITMSATGFPLVALTACIAAPLFNLLTGVGLGTLLRTAWYGTLRDIAIPNALVVLFVAHCVLLVRLLVEVPWVTHNRLTRVTSAGSVVAWLLLMPLYVLTSLGVVFKEPWIRGG